MVCCSLSRRSHRVTVDRRGKRVRRVLLSGVVLLVLGGTGPLAVSSTAVAAASCQGRVPTHAATADGQTVSGTDGPDVLTADGFRNITLFGLGGDDLLCGGPGADAFVAGAGSDSYDGGPGRDQLIYVIGAVRVSIDTGSATANHVATPADGGGTGTDHFVGVEAFQGSSGDDSFVGTDAAEVYDGSHGEDQVSMGGGGDRVVVAGGRVLGGAGDDQLTLVVRGTAVGGSGDDLVRLATFDRDTDHYIDGVSRETPRRFHVEGGRGDDEVRLHSFRDDEHRLVPEIRSSLTFAGGDGNDVLDLSGIDYALRADLARRTATWHRAHTTWTSLDVFHAGAKGDTVRGTARAERIYGERGGDVLFGLGGRDFLYGGPGADRAYGGPGRDACRSARRIHC
jgi:Ca2+-binding RTX toxin-like protein